MLFRRHKNSKNILVEKNMHAWYQQIGCGNGMLDERGWGCLADQRNSTKKFQWRSTTWFVACMLLVCHQHFMLIEQLITLLSVTIISWCVYKLRLYTCMSEKELWMIDRLVDQSINQSMNRHSIDQSVAQQIIDRSIKSSMRINCWLEVGMRIRKNWGWGSETSWGGFNIMR